MNKVSPGEKEIVEVPTQVTLTAACAAGASPATDSSSDATTKTNVALRMIALLRIVPGQKCTVNLRADLP